MKEFDVILPSDFKDDVFLAPNAMLELGMDVKCIRCMIAASEADAWVLGAAPREVLEWFSTQPVLAFALFGRRRRERIAATGPNNVPSMGTAAQRLIAFVHHRIVMIGRPSQMGLPPVGALHRVLGG
ncbi:MAG: hypothetical protein ACI9NC_004762 [Verrucomicrobiales bacterium]|jgi:hypothetical protein